MTTLMDRHELYRFVGHASHNLKGQAAEQMLDVALEELRSLRLAAECERRADSHHDKWSCALCQLMRRMHP